MTSERIDQISYVFSLVLCSLSFFYCRHIGWSLLASAAAAIAVTLVGTIVLVFILGCFKVTDPEDPSPTEEPAK